MLRLNSTLDSAPILSLRTGGVVANLVKIILNPDNLKIEGWYVNDRFSKDDLVLVSSDIREIMSKGVVINDHEVLTNPDDLIRLKSIFEIDFELIGKQVETEGGKKLGKVADFAIETNGLIVKKLYVTQSILKNLSGGTTSIDRTQIVEITNKRIIVEEPVEKVKVSSTATMKASPS